ncbi:hypothetical protein GF407_13760 [candidate division KSB1 bacterium]|nr:hypothetical protein [candidate division KSB1 bacterium]
MNLLLAKNQVQTHRQRWFLSLVFCFLPFMFYLRCYVPHTIKEVDLSVQTLRDYNLKPEEMTQLQYYLSDELQLKSKYRPREKSITRDLELYVDGDDNAVTLVFRRGLPCIGVHAWRDYKLKIGDHHFFGGPVLIKVCFDRYTNNCLTFVPNDTGKYVLDLNERGFIWFGGQRYKCPDQYKKVGLYFKVIDDTELNEEEREIRDRKLIIKRY